MPELGVGYQASALHLISYLVVDAKAPYTTEPPPGWKLPPIPGARYMTEPARFRSPATEDIIAWRDKLATKYAPQLGELLSWDEPRDFYKSEDAAVSGDLLLRYVAAVAQQGADELAKLVGRQKPAQEELRRALDGAIQRGFTGRFPQILLGAQIWLPFQRNLIIEEPDWQGKTNRFGSAYRLEDEVRELRAAIKKADPQSVQWTSEREVPEQILGAAWQASGTIARICAVATAQHSPLWTTG
ncbi:hypothetical protein DFR50_12424 [Roseiarcus fermentans]|uniref:Uncharacterized protein n=1 Tax=Roseiarcus fermentans TaxID=1473586 RepID=A0A366F1V9_9HYPH|nr:hypothetical protein DFR50_12424 [Roseiarcus fermentans]